MSCRAEFEMSMRRKGIKQDSTNWTRRCTWAIQFGSLATRCKKSLQGHGDNHVGRGLDQFPFQVIEWFKGDRREFETDREDFYAWEVKDGQVEVHPGENDPS